MTNNKQIYPEIVIPEEIYNIKKSSPKNEPKPIKPILKIKEKPNEPEKPESLFVTVLVGFAIICIGFLIGEAINILGMIMVFGPIAIIINQSVNYSNNQADYKEKYNDYLNELKLYDSSLNMQKSNENYAKELELYNQQLVKYENDTRNSLTQNYILNYRREKLKSYFLKSDYLEENDMHDYSKGIAEPYFQVHLENEFADVKTNYYINNYNPEIRPFMPDFIIFDEQYNIKIDIEIDEPYVGRDGTPIHLDDYFRNKFFTDSHFIVIRFSEFQTIKYPKQCCKIIKDIINWIKSDDEEFTITKTQELITHKKWTREEAYKMAFSRYRNSYLPVKLIEKISTESLQYDKDYQEDQNDDYI